MSESVLGYDTNIFVNKPADRYVCSLCLNILNNPLQCPNGHCCCKECITEALKVRKECPICKCKLSLDTLSRNLYVQTDISEMKTKCISAVEHAVDMPN